ncbi:hypothetical protein SDC9_98056 [bioreactor metagenome]|uniref:Uncharacterized protein n=1 Tax=bioreactor metagenome TaxID=1076179 RepID=A0A645AF23_9ZZZZ
MDKHALRDAENRVKAAVELQGAKPQRRGDAGKRREDGQDVDRLAKCAADLLLAYQRDEDRADEPGRIVAELVVGKRHGDDGISGPWVEPPVEEGYLYRVARRLYRTGLRSKWQRSKMKKRLGCSVEYQADSHSGRE